MTRARQILKRRWVVQIGWMYRCGEWKQLPLKLDAVYVSFTEP